MKVGGNGLARPAREPRIAASRRRPPLRLLRAQDESRGGERANREEEGGSGARATQKPRRGGGANEWRTWERPSARAVPSLRRERGRGQLLEVGERTDGWASTVSERGRRER
jgi:hypothetical protein